MTNVELVQNKKLASDKWSFRFPPNNNDNHNADDDVYVPIPRNLSGLHTASSSTRATRCGKVLRAQSRKEHIEHWTPNRNETKVAESWRRNYSHMANWRGAQTAQRIKVMSNDVLSGLHL